MSTKSEDFSTMNIYQKLAMVQRAVDIIQKDSSGYGYRYVSEAELLPKINAEVDKYGLTLYPGIVPQTMEVHPYSYEKKGKKAGEKETVNEFFTKADMIYTWVNNDNPGEKIEVPWAMVGDQGDSSQAFGSALTYSERYFLLKYFHCATVNDDPDKIRSEQKEQRAKSELDDILSHVDEIVQNVIAANPNAREDIRSIVTPYVNRRTADGKLVPTGNYFEIRKKAQANALLTELKKRYVKGDE